MTAAIARLEATHSGQATVLGRTISNGYQLPNAKQGVNDQRFFLVNDWYAQYPALRSARYQALAGYLAPGVRRYNVFWYVFESSTVTPSTSPVNCPAGYLLARLCI